MSKKRLNVNKTRHVTARRHKIKVRQCDICKSMYFRSLPLDDTRVRSNYVNQLLFHGYITIQRYHLCIILPRLNIYDPLFLPRDQTPGRQ